MIRNRVAPIVLPKVKEEHLVGVFGEFTDVIDDRIAALEPSRRPFDQEKCRFYRYLKQLVDAEKFGRMQEVQLANAALNARSDIAKYIDPTRWFESKLAMARCIGLDRRQPTAVLDIGTGPGHFPVVAGFYGHHAMGTDLPYRTTGRVERGHLYDALAEIYGIERIALRVEAFTPLELKTTEQRFGHVSALLAAFSIDADGNPWDIAAWKFFFQDLRNNVLEPDGDVYMTFDRGKITDEVWHYLADRAHFHHEGTRQIHWTTLDGFAD